MIEFSAGDTKIKLDFSFFAVITLFLCFDASGYGIMSLAACFFHESGHVLMMSIRGKNPDKIIFYGGGIKISDAVLKNDLLVITAGSAANFLIAATVFFFADGSSIYPLFFAAVNVIVGFFNLLPLGFLDGKNLTEYLLIKKMPPQKAMKIMQQVEIFTSFIAVLLVILLIIVQTLNFTLLIMLIYIFLLDIFS